MDIRGTLALVTGANGGLGEAIATNLKEAGADLILTGRNEATLTDLAKRLSAKVILADLSNPEDVARLNAEAALVDIAVMNAALPASGLVTEMDTAWVNRALDVNLRAPILSAHYFGQQMAARGRGHIVFISSLSGKVATRGSAMYSATKFGLRGFASALRIELAEKGIGVSTVFPGIIRGAGMFAKTGVKLPEKIGTRSPKDVAEAVRQCIEKDIGEVDVAAFEQRFGALLGSISPRLVAKLEKRFGQKDLAAQIMSAQRDVR